MPTIGTGFIAIAVEYIRNQGDAWVWILDHLTQLLDAYVPASSGVSSREDLLTDCDAICRAIGRRLGEMHFTLKRPTSDPAFEPGIATAADGAQWADTIKQRVMKAFDSPRPLSSLDTRPRSRARTTSAQQDGRDNIRC
jgi:maltose alpha-D-glucosyltransferase / alpha-amylase